MNIQALKQIGKDYYKKVIKPNMKKYDLRKYKFIQNVKPSKGKEVIVPNSTVCEYYLNRDYVFSTRVQLIGSYNKKGTYMWSFDNASVLIENKLDMFSFMNHCKANNINISPNKGTAFKTSESYIKDIIYYAASYLKAHLVDEIKMTKDLKLWFAITIDDTLKDAYDKGMDYYNKVTGPNIIKYSLNMATFQNTTTRNIEDMYVNNKIMLTVRRSNVIIYDKHSCELRWTDNFNKFNSQIQVSDIIDSINFFKLVPQAEKNKLKPNYPFFCSVNFLSVLISYAARVVNADFVHGCQDDDFIYFDLLSIV
jgi:hypothetical protein